STLTPSCAHVSASGCTSAATSRSWIGPRIDLYQARTRGPRSGASGALSASGTAVAKMPRSAKTIVPAITRAAVTAVPGRHGTSTSGSRRQRGCPALPLDLAAQEALDLVLREVVGELTRRVLHQIGGDAVDRPADSSVTCD